MTMGIQSPDGWPVIYRGRVIDRLLCSCGLRPIRNRIRISGEAIFEWKIELAFLVSDKKVTSGWDRRMRAK